MRATILAASSIPARILRPGRLRLCGRMPSTGSCRGGRSVSPAWCGQAPRDFGLSASIRSRREALQKIIAATRRQAPCGFWAWTPGLNWSRHADLAGIGFDGVFASTAWWDGRAAWYVEEHESLRRIAPVIGLVEAPMRIGPMDIGQRLRALRLAAATGDGLMMPAGFETDLEAEVKQATREAGCLSSFGAAGPMRRLSDASAERVGSGAARCRRRSGCAKGRRRPDQQ